MYHLYHLDTFLSSAFPRNTILIFNVLLNSLWIGGQLLYNIVSVSAMYQHESAIGICICPLPLEPPCCFPPFWAVTECQIWPPCVMQQIPTRCLMLLMVMCMFWCHSFNLSHPLLPPLCQKISSMSASPLLPCNRLISTIFLDSISMH